MGNTHENSLDIVKTEIRPFPNSTNSQNIESLAPSSVPMTSTTGSSTESKDFQQDLLTLRSRVKELESILHSQQMPSSPDTSSVSLTTPTNSKAVNLVKPCYSDGILPATLSESSSISGYSQDSQQTKISIDTVVFPAGKPALFKSSMTASIDNILSSSN
ncbi:unnamed protein product [[Candida] boidinii]|nr:unnamed protein product [[Candida] boidinii]